jgi:uncharacterized UPF0146 family protein
MAIRATISSIPKTRVSINKQDRETVRAVGIGQNAAVASQLRNLTDVNATNLVTNNTVVYDGVSDKFVVKELPKVNGGTF